ncbi:hypothetical protein KIW84_075981 [Lathyrus oleraceus]|uniref:Uncharacterized protein n=1 Tax=Pisum sativum TaxID=3888 RepID=A0A9D5A0L1_PEA|nr:hypothetical protein KIW84_075981 [Pisum sativum]
MLNPWEVKVVSDMPPFPFLPFLPSSKKLRLDQQPSFPVDDQLAMPTFPNNETPNDASTSATVSNRPTLQKDSSSENVSDSITISKQSLEKLDHAKPKELMLFGQTMNHAKPKMLVLFGQRIPIENAEMKITNYLSNPLQDLPKRSYGERLECNTENQCKKDTCDEETVEIEHSGSSSKEPV